MGSGKNRMPIQLVQANGKKHLTKAEIKERMEQEIQPQGVENIKPPAYLNAKQKRQFNEIADQLKKLGVMGETDCDVLARYITAQTEYEKVSKLLRKTSDIDEYFKLTLLLQKYAAMCRNAGNDLGLSISSRCKLIVPKTDDAKPKNKFSKFRTEDNK